jgi:glycosyltransferase involved in cell wall biosynthesis
LEALIEAAALVYEEIPKVKFILVGGTDTEITRLKRIVRKKELEDTIKLISRRPREEVPNYLSLADVLVLPRLTGKNAPIKIFEYIRSCKPIVATDIPAHRTMLSEQTAILVAPEPEALKKGICRALKEDDRIKKNAQTADFFEYLVNKPLKSTMEEVYQFIANLGQ